MKDYKLILASGSPRRKDILNMLQASYEAIPCTLEEIIDTDDPALLVENLAHQKAADVSSKQTGRTVTIGSDTVVAYKNTILGKPKSRQQAFDMIHSFMGDTHHVFSGVSIILANDGVVEKEIRFHESTEVDIYEMTDDEINAYIDTGEPMDKAGAYAIQGLFSPYVKGIKGDYYNIVGFPIAKIYHALRELIKDFKF